MAAPLQGMELLISLISMQTEILQQLSIQLNKSEAQRDALDAEREERAVRRDAELRAALARLDAEREERAVRLDAEREERAVRRDAALCAALASLAPGLQTRLPLARAGSGSGGGGGSPSPPATPQSSGGGASSPRSSQQQRSPLHETRLVRLRDAFSAAQRAGSTFDVGGLAAPFSAQLLLTRGARFAHRVACKGTVGDSRDFGSVLEGAATVLLPPAESGKAGMSFFITSAETPEALQAAHALHGAGSCIAYPLASLPAGMAFQADKVKAASEGAASAPIALHASLSIIERMPWPAFCSAIAAWEGRQVCLLAGAGAEGGLGAQGAAGAEAGALGAAASSGCHDATADLLKRAALSLADYAAV